MAVVAGIVFFFVRAILAAIPAFASRYPIKKWAAGAALTATTFYMLLSGAEVATQRSFVMIGIVLAGVLFDRPALTFRTLTLAALGVLLLAPEAVVQPSFQMSFAATLALVSGYQQGLPLHGSADISLASRAALWGAREIVGLVLASLVAGLATTPYAAYHFHRLAPYGVIANLLAMPVVSAAVMPLGILGVLVMPFGFDGWCWRLMGEGIDWMIDVAVWVANLPGAVGRIHAFGPGPLLLGTAGLLLLCLLRTPLRFSGAALLVLASLWAVSTPRPDVLVAGDGQAVAFRTAAGRLSLLHSGRDRFAVKEWLAADGDPRTPTDASLSDGVACDDAGCAGRLKDGRIVTVALAEEAFAEDCKRAAVIASRRTAPAGCAALHIDRDVWRQNGAIALRVLGGRFERTSARPDGYERPWAMPPRMAAGRSPVRDSGEATPRPQDLEPGD